MRSVLRSFGCATLACSLLGCHLVLGFEELQPESPGAGNQAGSMGASEAGGSPNQDACADVTAPAAGGSPLIKLTRTDDTCFFMDEHEVTNAQYAEFVAGEHPAPPPVCTWNEQYLDDQCLEASSRVTSDGDHPVVCVDQCDALAYCLSVDKELCRNSVTAPATAAEDDWYSACSNQGDSELPYGNNSTEGLCNWQESGQGTTWAVSVGTQCENAEGVRDLIGNVSEWVDACKRSLDADDECQTRGGSFIEQGPTCEDFSTPRRGMTADYLGFRCCAYLD